jgi:hypothetical protein
MSDRVMIAASAWNNGQHYPTGAGYGLSISAADRDQWLRREWGTVRLRIGNSQPFAVNIDKRSLWNGSCMHLISAHLGRWMREIGVAPWRRRLPPTLVLLPLEPGAFEVRLVA